MNASTGGVVWKYAISSGSSPAVAAGVVYITSNNGHTNALNAQNGILQWSSPGKSYDSYTSPIVANGVVYVVGVHHTISALTAQTGASLWSFVASGARWSSPVVVNSMLYLFDFSSGVSVFPILYTLLSFFTFSWLQRLYIM